jgi:UDP-N-acetylmuramoylalanine--D-glutamate ligase
MSRIAIAGYGVEGKASVDYFLKKGDDVTIFDEKDPGDIGSVSKKIGKNVFGDMYGYDIVMRSPSLNPNKIKTDGKIWSVTNEFFNKCQAKIIGVTGSKGKGTTCSLIYSMLKADGKNAYLIGNIGNVGLDLIDKLSDNDYVVYEMSSFQLWDIEKSPDIAVVLMIEADHLNVHKDMNEYVDAKANITRFQSGSELLVYNNNNIYATNIAEKSSAKRVPYQSSQFAHNDGSNFYYDEQSICSNDCLKLPGNHNIDNACAAIDAVWDILSSKDSITTGMSNFLGLPHRLKFVRKVKGISYYDDSIATTPGSAVVAMKAFKEQKTMIFGGSSKGADYNVLVNVAKQNNVTNVITIGAEGKTIYEEFLNSGINQINLGRDITMQDIVKKSSEIAQSGDIVILSPSCASFDMFKSYQDRGEQFIKAVESL